MSVPSADALDEGVLTIYVDGSMFGNPRRGGMGIRFAWLVLGGLLLLTPLGLLAPGTAWSEWSSTELRAHHLGFVPQGLSRLESIWRGVFETPVRRRDC